MTDRTVKLTEMLSELTRESIDHATKLLRETGGVVPFVMVTELSGDVHPVPLPADDMPADDMFRLVASMGATVLAAAVVLDLTEPQPAVAIMLEQAGGDAMAVVVGYRVRPADDPVAELSFGAPGGQVRFYGHDVELDEPAATVQPRRIWLAPPWQAGLQDDVTVDFGAMITHAVTLLTSALPGRSGFPPFMIALRERQILVFGEPPGNAPHQMDSNNDVAVQEFRTAATARAEEYRAVAFCYDGYLDDGRDVVCMRCEHRHGSFREFGYAYRHLDDATVEFGELVVATPRNDATIFGV